LGGLPLAVHDAAPGFRYDAQPSAIVPLDVAAETGVVGGLAYIAVLVAPWVALLRRRRPWSTELIVSHALLAAVTVIGLVDYYTWSYAPGRFWFWLVIGLCAGAHRRARLAEAARG